MLLSIYKDLVQHCLGDFFFDSSVLKYFIQYINNIPGYIVSIFPMTITHNPNSISSFNTVLIILLGSFD